MEIENLAFLKHFFRFNRRVYLDHNATTPVSRRVQREMTRVLTSHYGNPSSLYGIARKSAEMVEKARRQVAGAVGADAAEIIFTSCATESNNAVVHAASAHFFPGRKKIITTPIEHPSVLNTLAHLQTRGVVVEVCPVDGRGRLRLDELERQIDADTFLVCCIVANNETGVIQDIRAVAEIAQRHGALVLADCVQAPGKIPVDLHGWGVDYAAFSAHKLYGPKGIGALYVKQGSPFEPLLHGGHQEGGLRAGTESLHNIVGFGAACQDVKTLLAHAPETRALRRRLIERLKQAKPDCVINSPEEAECLPNTLSVTFPGVENAELMAMLDFRGVAVSAGSACSTGDDAPSHVLQALGISAQAARQTIRFSLGRDNTAADIDYTVRVIRDTLAGRTPVVNMGPALVNESILFDEGTFILDVRPPDDRRRYKGLPNAHEVPGFSLTVEKYLKQIPRDKRILVVCPGGGLSVMVSYYLKAKGYPRVTNLRGGLDAWRARRGDLYQKYAGQNIQMLEPDEAG